MFIIGTLAACIAAHAGDDPVLEHRLELATEIRTIAAQVPAEHPWAGVFKNPAGLGGHVLSITSDGRYVEVFSGCFGVDKVVSGHADVDGDWLVLNPQLATEASQRLGIIRWGDMRYLADMDEGREFVTHVNSFSLPAPTNPHPFLPLEGLRREEPKAAIPPRDTPLQLPAEFRAWLREQALEAHIVRINQRPGELTWRMDTAKLSTTLDRGRLDGIFVDMSLYATDADSFVNGRVSVVEDHTATFLVDVSRFDPSEEPDIPLLGTALSTHALTTKEKTRPAIVASLSILDESFDSVAWDNSDATLMHGRINRGSADGLRPGTLLWPVDHERRALVKIESVGTHEAFVKLRVQLYSHAEVLDDDERPQVGMQLTTN